MPELAADDPGLGVRASVCIATYNGARHVAEQLSSVLAEIGPQDEVVVIDDASSDETVALVRAVADPRVHLTTSDQNRGYVRTFEDALRQARGDVLVLADQDDVWEPGRLDVMLEALGSVDVVATNLSTLDGPDRITGPYGQADWHLRARASGQHRRNVLGVLAGNRPYYGCAMAVRRSSLDVLLPFPEFLVESHDLWIALYGNLARSIRHDETRTVRRRFHEDNASPSRPRGVTAVLRSRVLVLRCVLEVRRRLRERTR